MVSTFGAFTTARLGIIASQKALDTTGHNITNVNTLGYTRQTVDLLSLHTGGNGFYVSDHQANPGSGVLVSNISQLRDPYLDIRFRNELSSVGAMDGKLNGLQELGRVFDEVSKSGMANQFKDFVSQLQTYNAEHANQKEFDTLVRTSAEGIVKLFNSYSSQLKTALDNQEKKLNQDVESVNDILKSIQNLNTAIQDSEMHGTNALELRDERNNLIDELSQYMKIDVKYSYINVGAGKQVEKLSINLATGGKNALIDGNYAAQLEIPATIPAVDGNNNPITVPNDGYQMKLSELKDSHNRTLQYETTDSNGNVTTTTSVAVLLNDGDTYGSLESSRDILTKGGEFDNPASSTHGIPYYQKALDALANKFATEFNKANPATYKVPDIDPATGNQKTDPITGDLLFIVKNYDKGGDLFSAEGGGAITASNIKISDGWASGAVHILPTLDPNAGVDNTGSTKNSNILHMIALMDKSFDYKPSDLDPDPDNPVSSTTPYYSGSFMGMFDNTNLVLANDTKMTSTMLDTYAVSADTANSERDGVSGVDLNEEGMNLMQYQQSFAAACRLMTTLDEALDKIINGMGVVGR